MKISYAVTVCDEFIEIQRLLTFLLEHKRPQDEIVIQMDLSVADLNIMPESKKLVWQYIMKHNEHGHCRVIFMTLQIVVLVLILHFLNIHWMFMAMPELPT